LDWLLKTEEGSISYEEEELKMLAQDGVNEDGNLPLQREMEREGGGEIKYSPNDSMLK